MPPIKTDQPSAAPTRKVLTGAVAAAALLLCGALAGCAGTERVKDLAFTRMANAGNQYCKVRDPALAEIVNLDANWELRDKGAEFDIDITVTCDEAPRE